ncbi:MAG: site-2 protease family protein [Leptolyngbyaceae cyanobacterium CRU_2_3]|nr:site-2 protease family protein [Leptolyngbyaceae cyanobacterium CRU_2_3]
MIFWLLLIGILTYFIVQRSVANITRTPVWLLWLVMMMPAFTWMGWLVATGDKGDDFQLLLLLTGSFIVSSTLYWFLVQWGRPKPNTAGAKPQPGGLPEPLAAVPAEPRSTLRPMNKEEEASLQNCFPWSVYYLQNIEHRPQALICRGQLRTAPEVAYKTIQENITAHFSDRFLVVFQEGLNGKPFFALVPNPQSKSSPPKEKSGERSQPEQLFRPVLAGAMLMATLLTTTLAGALMGKSPDALPQNFTELESGLPYALAIMVILGIHESGHYLTARRYRIRTTLPYFIPVPPANIFPFGTFGAFIQMRSPIPNRKALFDVGIAGPLAGFIATIPILLWGLAHSTPIPAAADSGLLNFTSFKPAASLLIALLSKVALGDTLAAEQALMLNPVAIAGCLGLVITALNLMPVGQLDGGHIVHAMFGQRTGATIGQISRLLILALSFIQKELFLWALLLFLMPVVDEPALNDVSDLDNRRDFLGLSTLCLLLLIILPAPQALMQILF